MKKIILFLLSFATFISCYSQIEIYKTFENYTSNSSIKYDIPKIKFYKDFSGNSWNDLCFDTKVDGKKTKIKLTDYWGFKYNGILFRTVVKGNKSTQSIYVGLLSTGKILYWEDATMILTLIDKKTNDLKNYEGYGYNGVVYLSTSIESDFTHSKFRAFFNKNVDGMKAVNCLKEKSKIKISAFLNKHDDLDGNDEIGLFNFYARANADSELNLIRSCFKEYNGNFNNNYKL